MIGVLIGPDMFVVAIVFLVGLLIPLRAIADAASRPSGAFRAAGSSKAMGIPLIAVFWLITDVIGFILACVHLASIRPRVEAISP